MRELIKGVTKIRSIDDAGNGSASIYGKGILTYVGISADQQHTWVDTKGNVQYWGTGYGLGHYWEFVDEDESPKLEAGDNKVMHETLSSKVKSTGSSSDYYKIVLPEWLLLKQKDNGFIMLEDLAEIMFDNDFNYVNVMKAQKRMFDLEVGRGKEGNTFEYDATKCKYYIDKQVEVFNREQENK